MPAPAATGSAWSIFDLAAAAQSVDLHEAVLSPMTELRNRTGETVQVAVLDGREVVYVERLDSPNTLRLFLEVGRRNSAHSHRLRQGVAGVPAARSTRPHAAQLEADRRRRTHTITDVSRAAQGSHRGAPARVTPSIAASRRSA